MKNRPRRVATGIWLCAAFTVLGQTVSSAQEMQPLPVPGGVSTMLQEAETETEMDWGAYVSGVEAVDGSFSLDEQFIEAYGEESCSNMIFYGDSRVVGMSYTIGGNYYVGMVGAGYDWMQGEGLPDLERMMSEHPDADIVFCFGVNDPGNIESYIQFFNMIQQQYPDRRFWYLSVNPVYDGISSENGYFARNAQIESFNARLQEAFPDRYIDSWSYLKEYGYNAQDGVHYDGDTYFAIQNFCWRAITQKLDEQAQEMETESEMPGEDVRETEKP